ncbi:MAG: hypothetical protein CFE24_05080 [Flavobacterium sp. BFFFF2]|nr:MAG: hypothetical protein CFE24_05080 [Flavobacterium sp. BFFFF2]
MRQFYFVISLLSISLTQAQNDSIYFWKSGALLEKRSIKTADLDSITFKRPTATPSPCGDTTAPYPTVTIGSQVWMQKNLNVCKYRNGDDIPQVQDPTAWAALTTGAWCYNNNDTANGPVYGKLYNWYAVNDPRGLAPTGYHIPSDAEWTTLTTFLGGESVAGNKMKATTLWAPFSGITNTNSSGFTGLPGGYRNYDGTFYSVGTSGSWWSSSENSTTPGWYRGLNYNYSRASRNNYIETDGFSVRCLRD